MRYEQTDELEGAEEVRFNAAVERVAAADALRKWIDLRQPENRHILDRLEVDLREDRHLNEWGQFALEDLLRLPRRNLSKIRWHNLANFVTFLRNLILFVPVGITWYSIERAAAAYGRELENRRSTTFLQVWIESDQLKLTLGRTALIDAAVILFLIVLTMLSAALEWRAEKAIELADQKDEADFREVLVNVGLFLHGFRAITPSALKSGLAEAVSNLRKSSEQLALVAQKATETLGQFAIISTSQLEPAVKRIDVIVSALGSAATSHEQMGAMVKGMQDGLGQSLAALTSGIDKFGDVLQQKMLVSNRLLEASIKGLHAEMDKFGDVLQQKMSTNNQQLEAAIFGLLAETKFVAGQLSSVAIAAREVAVLFRESVPDK